MITRHEVATKLIEYLEAGATLEGIVAWAEDTMMEGDFEEGDLQTIRDIVSRLGLADVRQFGLTWEDCRQFLSRLGYQVRIEVSERG